MSTPITTLLVILATCFTLQLQAQGVGIGVENPNPNAVLELVSPNNNQGLLVPKMTTAQLTRSSFTANLSEE